MIRIMKSVFDIKLWFIILIGMTACTAQSQSTERLEPLGEVVIPYNYLFKYTPIGGLSGLTYERATDTFYVISDDRSELAGARFYSFQLQLNEEGKLDSSGVKWKDMAFLKTPSGDRYKQGTIDPEGVSVTPDSLIYVTSEGGRATGAPPFINAYHKDGTFVKSMTVPTTFWPDDARDRSTQGIRTNLAFESLTLTPDGQTLYVATENALIQDGPAADTASSSPARIIAYDVASGEVLHEYCYDVNKVFLNGEERGPFAVNGLSDLQAIDNSGHLLALDRNYVQDQGNRIGLYDVRLQGATDIKGISDMRESKAAIKPVKKQLIADLSDFGIIIDNFEGLTFGPELPGGGRLLVIVSDNNFSDTQQTVFTAFRFYK